MRHYTRGCNCAIEFDVERSIQQVASLTSFIRPACGPDDRPQAGLSVAGALSLRGYFVHSTSFIDPAPFGCYKQECGAKTNAGPSTAFGAKNAPNSAQDDNAVVAHSFRAGSIIYFWNACRI